MTLSLGRTYASAISKKRLRALSSCRKIEAIRRKTSDIKMTVLTWDSKIVGNIVPLVEAFNEMQNLWEKFGHESHLLRSRLRIYDPELISNQILSKTFEIWDSFRRFQLIINRTSKVQSFLFKKKAKSWRFKKINRVPINSSNVFTSEISTSRIS